MLELNESKRKEEAISILIASISEEDKIDRLLTLGFDFEEIVEIAIEISN
jgi:hypothetical protein